MKESISESWTVQLVAAFILLFVAFLALIISYSKSFKTKNEVISIIEKYEGPTNDARDIIASYLISSHYNAEGRCPQDGLIPYVGYEDEDGDNEFKYCLRPNLVHDGTLVSYDVVLFYTFNIPVFGEIITFEVKGTTIDLSPDVYWSDVIFEF